VPVEIALRLRLPGDREFAQALGLAMSAPFGIGKAFLLPSLGAFARRPQIDQLSHGAPPGYKTPQRGIGEMPRKIPSLLWWRSRRQLNTRLVDGNRWLSARYRIPVNKGAIISD
jgi:hypothetical protein